jgi:regulator of protease activity HflC (stomatin/prohibitin superfamily)
LKVNDLDGNPIEIAAVVVWMVVDTAEASFQVDSYENYVHIQSEAAVRNLATNYPYDSHNSSLPSLLGTTAVVANHLRTEIHDRLVKAGVEVLEARISHLAYAPEIAAAMLQRQQAGAIIAARQKIVEGAVGMVEMAIDLLSSKQVVQLDEERKAAMVSNLLVVLCGERSTQPVINAGSLY